MARNFFNLKQTKATPGGVIRSFRRNFRMTQRELAQVTGIAETNISSIENGRIEIGVRRAVLISAAFGIDPASILFPNGFEAFYVKDVKAVRSAAQKWMAKKKVG